MSGALDEVCDRSEAHASPVDVESHRWRRRAALFLAPTVLFLALGVRPLEPLNGQDGYLYTGMVPRMYDFLNRFPDAYYGGRFGYTLPTWVVTKMLGFEGGYLALRLCAIGAICVVLTRHVRASGAIAAAVLLSTSPIVLVAAFNTYTLSVGVLAFIGGAVTLATAGLGASEAVVRCAAAGALFATSWNAHLVVLPICLAIGLLFVIDQARQAPHHRVRAGMHAAGAIAAGAIVVTVVGVAVYGTRFGLWDVYGPSLEQARRPTDTFYIEPGWRWVSWRHYLWVGPLAVVAGAVTWHTEVDVAVQRAVRRLTLYTTAALAIFAAFQWMQDDPLLATYFYSALPLGLATATLAYSAAAVISRAAGRSLVGACALAALAPVTLLVAPLLGGGFAVVSLMAMVAVVVASALVIRAGSSAAASVTAVTVLLVSASWATVSSPHDFPATPGGFRTDPYYDTVLWSFDWTSIDRAQLVDEFARSLPSLPDERGAMRVWFDPAIPYDQLSAPLAWRRSSLNGPDDPPPPAITPSIVTALQDDRPRFVVIVDGQEADAALAAQNIAEISPYSVVWSKRFVEGQLVAHAVLLERAAGTWPDYPCREDGVALPCPVQD